VSLGTTDMDEIPLLERVLEALAHESARIVATVGEHADPASISTPANATVTPFVQHTAVLPHADLVITHGGLGTGLAALAHGVPVLCIPLGRDQPVNAAAIARTGAGKVLPAEATSGQIARTARELLSDPAYRTAARRVAQTLPAANDRHPAADLIDALAR
jgi:MGT family glycosyltransferase